MEIIIKCDCGRPIRVINSRVKIEDQIMIITCTPCENCIDHSWQHGYKQGESQKEILNEIKENE